jgi:chromosome partitioning protein
MSKTIAICNQKGGVGKTTTTVNLGVGLARAGYRVLLVDPDPQGDLTASLGIQNAAELKHTLRGAMEQTTKGEDISPAVYIQHYTEPTISRSVTVDFLPANIELSGMEAQLVNEMRREAVLADTLAPFKDSYDYVLIDCMPSLGMLTINALTAADSVIIPVQAQYLAAKGMTDLVKTIMMTRRRINPRLTIDGIVMTLYNNTNLAATSRSTVEKLVGDTLRVFGTNIPVAVKTAESSAAGQSIYCYAPESPVAKAYESLTQEVLDIHKDTLSKETGKYAEIETVGV